MSKVDKEGVPMSLEAERLVLGCILRDDSRYAEVAAVLRPSDFGSLAHQRIYLAMIELAEAGCKIDRVTVGNLLHANGQLKSIGGVAYLASIDEGMPALPNLDSYVKIVREKAALRYIQQVGNKLLNAASSHTNPADLAAKAAAELLQSPEIAGLTGHRTRTIGEVIRDYPGGINALLSGPPQSGLKTGFIKYDELTGGLHAGELVIVAARPSVGKTALALQVALRIAKNGGHVLFFSLEMSAESLFKRLVAVESRVDHHKQRLGFLSGEERHRVLKAATEIESLGLHIDDSGSLTPAQVLARARRVKTMHGLSAIFVDYLQLVSADKHVDNRVAEIGQITRAFKLIAKELEVPFVCLSQLSRAPEVRGGDHRPQLWDLRDSGTIEQDADTVVFLYREEMYKPDRADLKGLAELIIAKQRNGPVGKCKLVFLRELTRFENMASEEEPITKEKS